MKICHKNTCDRLNVNLLNNVENNFLDPLKDDFLPLFYRHGK